MKSNWSPGDLAHWMIYHLGGLRDAKEAELRERNADGQWYDLNLQGVVIHDRRNEKRPPELSRGRPRPPRSWKSILGVTFHQTASGHLHPHHPKLLGIPAHIIIHQNASVTLLHPLVLRMPHGNALNSQTIGIEVDCREPGLLDDPTTVPLEDERSFWRSRRDKERGKRMDELIVPVTDAQLDVMEHVAHYCYGAFLANAPKENWPKWGAWAHRQGHRLKASDPGERIAQRAESIRRRYGWLDVSEERKGSGQPQPDQWVDRKRGVRY